MIEESQKTEETEESKNSEESKKSDEKFELSSSRLTNPIDAVGKRIEQSVSETLKRYASQFFFRVCKSESKYLYRCIFDSAGGSRHLHPKIGSRKVQLSRDLFMAFCLKMLCGSAPKGQVKKVESFG